MLHGMSETDLLVAVILRQIYMDGYSALGMHVFAGRVCLSGVVPQLCLACCNSIRALCEKVQAPQCALSCSLLDKMATRALYTQCHCNHCSPETNGMPDPRSSRWSSAVELSTES